MADAADLQDWELLSSRSSEDPKAFEGLDGDGDSYGGAIELDYFALDSENRRIERESSEEESEEGGVDSDNPTRVLPDSNSRDMERSRGEVEFRGSGSPVKNSGGFWSDGSLDYRSSLADSESGELGNRGGSITEVGVEGIEAGYQDSSDDESGKGLGFGGSRQSQGIETGYEEHGVEDSGGLVKMEDGSGSFENVPNSDGEKRVLARWKMPLDFIKFYVFKMRPVWWISIAAAIMGFVMLGRKLYKMKNTSRTIQLKIAFDDKLHGDAKGDAFGPVELYFFLSTMTQLRVCVSPAPTEQEVIRFEPIPASAAGDDSLRACSHKRRIHLPLHESIVRSPTTRYSSICIDLNASVILSSRLTCLTPGPLFDCHSSCCLHASYRRRMS